MAYFVVSAAGVTINVEHIVTVNAALLATLSNAATHTLSTALKSRPEFIRLAGSRIFVSAADVQKININADDTVQIRLFGDETSYQVHSTQDAAMRDYLINGGM